MTHIHACLFGSPALFRHDKGDDASGRVEIPLPASTAARSLMAFLLLRRRQAHPRPVLAGTFWPDMPEPQARRALTQALWHIRRALPGLVCADTDGVTILADARVWVDVQVFQELLDPGRPGGERDERADLRMAIELYRGDLLEGFYDDWILAERERLREIYIRALERLVYLEKSAGQFQPALDIALRLTQVDPLQEAAHREVMRLHVALGQPEAALRQFEVCRRVLQDELDLEPDAETMGLAVAIRSAGAQESLPYLPLATAAPDARGMPTLPVALVGREAERRELLAHIEEALHGGGGMVLVEGEAGAGKTRLMQEIARDAAWRGAQVIWGRGRELEGAGPYTPWVEALQDGLSPLRAGQLAHSVEHIWLQVLAQLLPALRAQAPALSPPPPLEPKNERDRLVNAIAQLLAAWGQYTPLVIILEDLHWAGENGLDLCLGMAERIRRQRVLVIGTYRSGEARAQPRLWEQLSALDRTGLCGRLVLPRLDSAATGELIRHSLGLGQPAPAFEGRVYRETQGNPLFVLETLRALCDEGLLFRDQQGTWNTPWDETTADYAELPLPRAVERVIARRLEWLAPVERATLEAASVLGSDFDFRLLQAACGVGAGDCLAAAGALVRRHLLDELPEVYAFSHAVIREMAYRGIAPDALRMLHRRAAEALEALRPGGVQALAYHYTHGEVWDKAARAHVEVGRQAAAVYAARAALDAYDQALDILREHQPFSGDDADRVTFDILAARCSLLQIAGSKEQCAANVEAMLALATHLGTPDKQVEALLRQAEYLGTSASEYAAALDAAEEARTLARKHGLRRGEAEAWQVIGDVHTLLGQYPAAEEALHHALAAWRELGEPATQVTHAYLQLVSTYRGKGDLDRAEAAARKALEMAEAQRDMLALAHVHNGLAWIARAHGDHRAEADHCRAMLAQMQAIGHRYYEGVALNNLSLACSALGDLRGAAEAAEQALGVFRQIGHRYGQTLLLLNLSSRYKEIGRPAQARAALAEGLQLAQQLGLTDEETRMLSSLAELLTNVGEFAAAGEALDRADEISRALDSAYLSAMLRYRRGMLCLRTGDPAEAGTHFAEAARMYAAGGSAEFANAARSYLAASHLQLGDLPQAIALSTQAWQDAESRTGGPDLDVYFNHYQVMRAAGETTAALAALEKAHALVQERCSALPDPEWRRGSITDVPLHQTIVTAWEALKPTRVTVRLPRAGAPTGRALRDDEQVAVTWTVAAAQDDAIPDKVARRRARLLRLLEEAHAQGATPTVEDLAAALEASPATVKRDLAALRVQGHVVRTRGAAC